MKNRIVLGILFAVMIVFSLSFAETVNVPLVIHTGTDPDAGDSLFIQIQVATDSQFVAVIESVELPCAQNVDITYQTTFNQNEVSKKYYWHARHRDQLNAFSAWTPARNFTFVWNTAPSGCSAVSPANGATIRKSR